MNVLFDSQIFDLQTHGGISRCFAELYTHMPEHVRAKIGIVETNNIYLQQYGFKHVGDTYLEFMGSHSPFLRRLRYKMHYQFKYGKYSHWNRTPQLNQLEQERLLKEGDYDVFHPTFYNPYFLPYMGDKPFVVTVHDMIPEIYTQFFAKDGIMKQWKQEVVPKASHIVAVSEYTKQDLIRIMGIAEDKISVVYHGADDSPYIPTPQRPYDFEYILYVGERSFYKNFMPFYQECLPLLKRYKDLKVVCTGKPFTEEELSVFEGTGMKNRMIQIFTTSDQQLMDLYHHALAFVYPSEYEGFGIPILEAYKADCPVMLNHASCFPEIAGDAAIYFGFQSSSPKFEEQFEALYHLDSHERESLLAKQRDRLKKFSWEESARSLAKIYEQVI